MSDALLVWNSDLAANPVGDVALANGTQLGQQRVLRRLLTNPGDYIWHPTYGAGLAQFIGATASPSRIRATIRSQIFLESAVSRNPEPTIDVESGADGSLYIQLQYVDAVTSTSQILSFNIQG